jgi:hypothetical protein
MSEQAKSDAPAAWEIAIQIVGTAAGFAAFVYLIGAMTVWVRLTTAGYPADVALESMSKTRVAAIGLRGILVVALLLIPVLILGFWYVRRDKGATNLQWIQSWWFRGPLVAAAIFVLWVSSKFGRNVAFMVVSLFLVALVFGIAESMLAVTSKFKNGEVEAQKQRDLELALIFGITTKPKRKENSKPTSKERWVLIVAGTAAIVFSGFVSWRGLAVVLALLASVGLMAEFVQRRRQDTFTPASRRWLIAGVVVIEGVAGLAWQVQAPVKVSSAEVSPPVAGEFSDEFIPFFGESGGFVYLGEVTNSKRQPNGTYTFDYAPRIIEIPRNKISLLTFGSSVILHPRSGRPIIETPAELVRSWFTGVKNRITGQ